MIEDAKEGIANGHAQRAAIGVVQIGEGFSRPGKSVSSVEMGNPFARS